MGSRLGRPRGALTDPQRLFCRLYLQHLNANRAAEEAGFAPKHKGTNRPGVYAARLLRKASIQHEIKRQQRLRLDRLGVQADDVVEALRRVAMVDVRQFFDADGRFIPLHELPPELATTVQGFDLRKDGTVKVRLANRNAALETLARHLRLVQGPTQQIDSTVTVNVTEVHLNRLSIDELEVLDGLLEKAGLPPATPPEKPAESGQ